MPDIDDKGLHRPHLLVTGAGGKLGHWICRLALQDWEVFGNYRHHHPRIPGVKALQANLTRESEIIKLLEGVKPRAVIHTAAETRPSACEEDPQGTYAINVKAPEALATICADEGIPFIFSSTDLVFDGLNAPYSEQAPVSPVCEYGRQKARAEQVVLSAHARSLVCRMPLMFGMAASGRGDFSMQMLSAIVRRRPLNLFSDEFRTPVDYSSAAHGLLRLLPASQGIVHLGGKTRVSRYEMGVMMAERLGIPPTMLRPVFIESFSTGAARSPDCSLDSHYAYGLGYDPLPLSQALQSFAYRFQVISGV